MGRARQNLLPPMRFQLSIIPKQQCWLGVITSLALQQLQRGRRRLRWQYHFSDLSWPRLVGETPAQSFGSHLVSPIIRDFLSVNRSGMIGGWRVMCCISVDPICPTWRLQEMMYHAYHTSSVQVW